MLSRLFQPYQYSETALLLSFGNEINATTTQDIRSVNEAIRNKPFPGFIETVPAYTSLTIFYDLIEITNSDLPGDDAREKITRYLDTLEPAETAHNQNKPVLIPVCYEGIYAPDMKEVTRFLGLPAEDIIRLHSDAEYEVAMLGFMPGFPYLTGMDKRLIIPRKDTPGKRVPGGSVGIAGVQTGIYPFAAPGGWQLIGRTPMQLFSLKQDPPALLAQGFKVKFAPISATEFERLIS